jgi:trans-aconitate 2-methyltransferase
MADWNPSLYLKFGAERTRPAAELVARIAQHPVTFAVDLGCGPGNSTALLHQAWPEATLIGVDSSPAMLDDAARALPTCRFVAADIRQYQPERPADLLYANASLQWLTDHETLFPHLVNQLADNGLLAVQMPDNWQEPSHTLMRQVAQEMGSRRADVIRCRACRRITIFLPPAVARWISGERHIITRWSRTRRLSTGCNPRASPLSATARCRAAGGFSQRYLALLQQHYPLQCNGKVLLFPRLFIVAQRKPRL